MNLYRQDDVSKTFLVGDLHLGVKNNSTTWLKIAEEYLTKTFINQIIEKKVNPDKDILILEGDIFHNRQLIDVIVQQTAIRIFLKLCEYFSKIYIIAGNHDVYYKDNNSVTSLTALKTLIDVYHEYEGKIIILTEPSYLVINKKFKYLMLPWEHDNVKLAQTIDQNKDKCDYIICHADVKGAKFNRFVKVESGLDAKGLSAYKKVYAGHIHIRQDFNKSGAMISYTGTPYQMDRGDVGNKKGFDILEYHDTEVIETFVENVTSPRFVKYNIYKLLDATIDEIKLAFNNNFVDISVDSNISTKFNPTSFLELIGDTNAKSIEFTNYTSESDIKVSDLALTINEDELTLDNIFEIYCDQKSYDKLQRSLISNQFKVYLKEVRNAQKTEL